VFGQIVPYSIGETNAAYLFGSEVSDEYDVIWSECNALMMNAEDGVEA
jgi:hypothetical protein